MAAGGGCSTVLASFSLVTGATTAPLVGVPHDGVGSSTKRRFSIPNDAIHGWSQIGLLGSPASTLCGHGCGPVFLLYFSPMTRHPRSRPKLRFAIFFSPLLILFILSVFMFACKHCPDGFSAVSARGLSQHQKKCEAFLKREDDANQRRKATAISNKVKKAKRKGQKMRLNSAAPRVSLFTIIDKYHG